jgi:DNA-binding MarR family transcriptional regulator
LLSNRDRERPGSSETLIPTDGGCAVDHALPAPAAEAPKRPNVPASAQPTLQLMHLLVQVAARRDRAASDILAPFNLSPMQWRLLLYVAFAPDAAMGEVADYLVLDRTSLTRAVDKMVDRELVLRTEPPHDRRMTTLRLTPQGRALFDTLFVQFTDHAEWLLEAAGEEEIRTMTRVLEATLTRLIGHRSGARRILNLF